MKPLTVMVIAGEASGDLLGAELVGALRATLPLRAGSSSADAQPLSTALEPRFMGAGGPRMAAAGVELAFDMTTHAVIGLSDALKHYPRFRGLFNRLLDLALATQPDIIICVDFSGFNRRFAHAVKNHVRKGLDWFHNWNPKLVQYVSPQVWASREGRARKMAGDYDLLLSIIPFEPEWYAKRVPELAVKYVGNPILDRHRSFASSNASSATVSEAAPRLLLLPGSRRGELQRHVPVMLDAVKSIHQACRDMTIRMVLPSEALAVQARSFNLPPGINVQVGGLPEALKTATLAMASTGTVTMECALFRVPTVALYKTSWTTYQIAKRIVKVKYLSMPNLLAGEPVFPEFIQNDATPQNLAGAVIELLKDPERRAAIRQKLGEVIFNLGPPGASQRAAEAIAELLERK